jgi:hypothetical protein
MEASNQQELQKEMQLLRQEHERQIRDKNIELQTKH